MNDQELIEAEGDNYYERKFKEHCELIGCYTLLIVFMLGIGTVYAGYKFIVWLIRT